MKISKALLVDPERNSLYGCAAVALSIFVFAYSTRFGQVFVLAYYACWLPLLLVDRRRILDCYWRFGWIVAFAVLACLSVFWSAAPTATARAGVQLLSHVICALIAARTISLHTLCRGAIVGIFVVLLYSFAFGQYNYDPLDGTYSFVGAFSSKNQIGLFASLGIYFAFSGIFILRERAAWRLLALVCGAVSAVALAKAQSATSVLAIVATLGAVGCLMVVMKFPPSIRKIALVAASIIAVVAVFAATSLGAFDVVLGAFGKDSTLTGRTYLWSQGWEAAAQAPVFGVGYQAYWVQGFSEAERLWAEFYIGSRSGFHFHNTYIEVLVELGAVGLVLIAMLMIRVPFGFISRLASARHDPVSLVAFGIAWMFLIRSFVEVDVINPYVVGSFLLYYVAGLLASPLGSRHAVISTGQRDPFLKAIA
ncbi:exopolysaccharide production protein ExoQ [Pseudaminobacter salicylatoxidans]|uniref:Exopolysaccharide production protein ExoQ n=1 Tax=Pseudaminobacter salicylatoxidans TaxID=93369 RepID=A0A316C1Q6_PSESE|nr:O-antigen ligase [Pseudaminobacter salicylatoxidans]PWJ82396.1 exopolysaccharide production protein ExoQ [Pseudaminobacter salicylatoxidans]